MTRPLRVAAVALALMLVPALDAAAQDAPKPRGSSNVRVLANLPLPGPMFSRSDVEIEQELSRPFAYVSRTRNPTYGFDIVDLGDPSKARVIYEWRIEDPELHRGTGAMDPKYFKHEGRYYLVQSFQFRPGGPDADLGAIVFDVTGLPDVSTVREVGRIRTPERAGGFHNIFMYKHSDGRPLLFATVSGPRGAIFDMAAFLAGAPDQGLIGELPWPSTALPSPYGMLQGYHDFYVAYDASTGQDKAYGAGYDGYYVYDVTVPSRPALITSVVGVPGVTLAHTLSVEPTHRYAVGQTEYLYSPVRLYDLEPGLTGQAQTISQEAGVWTANWRGFTHNHEIRWPFVFVSSFDDGLQVFDMRDPANATTVGWFDTQPGPSMQGHDPRTPVAEPAGTGFNGAWGIDVRNADGLIVVSDFSTGFWAMRMDGFDGWNGAHWGLPNISSAQDWDNGPARRPVSQ